MSELTERDDQSLGDFDIDTVPTADRTITVCHVTEDYDLYGGRGPHNACLGFEQPSHKGWLGNPFRVADYGREKCIERFEQRFLEELVTDRAIANAVIALDGNAVACHCRRSEEDEPACHLDVVRHWLLEGYAFYVAKKEHDIPMADWKLDVASEPEFGGWR